jgi:hypothetical protein
MHGGEKSHPSLVNSQLLILEEGLFSSIDE